MFFFFVSKLVSYKDEVGKRGAEFGDFGEGPEELRAGEEAVFEASVQEVGLVLQHLINALHLKK